MSTTILCVGDLHLSDLPPSQCTDSYNDDLFTMLWEIVEIACARAADAVVFAGDLFHLKAPSRTSHRTVQRMIDVVQSFHCPVYLVVGNHDIQNDRVDSIHETQPFGVLLRSGAHLLSGWAIDLPLYGVSWQQHWDGDVSHAFFDWNNEVDARCGSDAILVTHAPLYPLGQELPWENIPADHFAATMCNVGSCYYGHVHDLHGSFVVDDVVFCNQGAVSRGSLHESDLSRRPAVTLWRSGVVGLERFERVELVSAPSADKVFRLAEAVGRSQYEDRLRAFLAGVAGSAVEITSVESVLSRVQAMGLSAADVALAEEVLTLSVHGELKR